MQSKKQEYKKWRQSINSRVKGSGNKELFLYHSLLISWASIFDVKRTIFSSRNELIETSKSIMDSGLFTHKIYYASNTNDLQSIKSDFINVGKDLRKSMKEISEEIEEMENV